MVDMGIDNIVHHYRDPLHDKIWNSCIKVLESDILRTWDQENEQQLLQKYNNLRFLDDEENQTYIIAPENLNIKGPTRINKQNYVVGKPLKCMDGNNMDLLISRDINDDLMVLIKGVEQDPDMGVKIVYPSIDDDSRATYSD